MTNRVCGNPTCNCFSPKFVLHCHFSTKRPEQAVRVFSFERGSSHLLLTRICVLRELCTQNRCHKCRYSVALLTDCRFYQQNQNRPLAVCFNLNFRTNNALHFYFSKCSATFSSNSVTGRCCGHALSQLLHFMQ